MSGIIAQWLERIGLGASVPAFAAAGIASPSALLAAFPAPP
jgi:hypothetical protein